MITGVVDFGAVMVPLFDVAPHPANFRHMMVDLDELAASITISGLDEPLVVMPAERVVCAWPEHAEKLAGAAWVLLWGHRRLAAARQAYAGDSKAQVPVIVRNDEVCDSRQAQLDLMTRNALAARSWNPIEEARALEALVDAGRTQVEIAELCGCHQSHVSGRLALLRLPEEIAAAVETGKLGVADARKLARLDDQEQMRAVWRLFLDRREDAWITSIDQAISAYADRAAYQARRQAALEQAQVEGLRVVDPIEEFGANLIAHRLDSPDQVRVAGAAGDLVAGISGEGGLIYYTTSPAVDPPPAALSQDQRRAAAAARERAARLLAANPPTVPIEAASIIDAFLEVAPQGWQPIAQRWLRRLHVGPSGEPDPDRWWELVRDSGWSSRVWAAHCLSLASCEHGARTHDVWDDKDVAWVMRLMTEGGYVPRQWERRRLDGGDDHARKQVLTDRSPVRVSWYRPHDQCQAEIRLSAATVQRLELDPRQFHEVELSLQCDLERGHSGQHVAQVHDAHAEHYPLELHTGLLRPWANWDDETDDCRISAAASCPATRPRQGCPSPNGDEELDQCLLFAGHPGRHK